MIDLLLYNSSMVETQNRRQLDISNLENVELEGLGLRTDQQKNRVIEKARDLGISLKKAFEILAKEDREDSKTY